MHNIHTPNLEFTFSLIPFWYRLDSLTKVHILNQIQEFCEIKY